MSRTPEPYWDDQKGYLFDAQDPGAPAGMDHLKYCSLTGAIVTNSGVRSGAGKLWGASDPDRYVFRRRRRAPEAIAPIPAKPARSSNGPDENRSLFPPIASGF
jgi:hypothetical protein